MATYVIRVEDDTLADIENDMGAEENSKPAEVVDWAIAAVGNKPTNMVKFKKLAAGHPPAKDLRLIEHGTALPEGTTKIWEGALLVGTSLKVVIACR